MRPKTAVCVVVLCTFCGAAQAIPTITAGSWTVGAAPSQSIDVNTVQQIAIFVSGDDPIQGVDLALNVSGGLGSLGIQAVDLIGPGTIFHGNNTGQTDFLPFGGPDQFSLTTTVSGTVTAGDGVGGPAVLAFLTFDGTAASPAMNLFNLSLTNLFGSSDLPPFFPPAGVNLVNGTVTVEPEPGSIVLALIAAAALCVVAARRRRESS